MVEKRGAGAMVANTIFSVRAGAAEPIYLQLIDQVKRLVAAGQLKPGDLLPSVRDVAQSLAINPMTVSRAYSALETEGIVARRHGVGMAIANEDGIVGGESKASLAAKRTAKRIALLKPTLERAAQEAAQLEIDADDAVKLFQQILRGKK